MFPVRCYTCNNLIGHRYREWMYRITEKEAKRDILDSFGMTRMCCRRMFLTHVHVMSDLLQYSNIDQVMDDCGTVMYLEPEGTRCVSCD